MAEQPLSTVSSTSSGNVSEEKRRHLRRLSDDAGRFSMLAVDQRQSLRRMIARQTGAAPAEVAAERLVMVKEIVASTVASIGTAILLDPQYGQPEALKEVPAGVGLLTSAEVSGYRAAADGERHSRLLADWSPRRLKTLGADGVKLLIWHHAEMSKDTRQHQARVVEQVGRGCAEAECPFLLEVKTYPIDDDLSEADWARRKPQHVIDGARTYSAPRFGVDLLKMEFPAFLRHTEEYQDASFGQSPAVYDLSEVRALCEQLDDVAAVPWVILSAGVDLAEFLENVRVANEAGASGFLCGRTIWKGAMDLYPRVDDMRSHMQDDGRSRFEAILDANKEALPWQQHRCFQEAPEEVVS